MQINAVYDEIGILGMVDAEQRLTERVLVNPVSARWASRSKSSSVYSPLDDLFQGVSQWS